MKPHVVIGDIHGRQDKVEKFLAYRPEATHVFLGDYLDSFKISWESQIDCLKTILASDAILLWGNHDLHYLPDPPFLCSGRCQDPNWRRILSHMISENKRRFLAAYTDGKYLMTHGGLSEKLVKHPDLNKQVWWLNNQMLSFIKNPKRSFNTPSIFSISVVRGGVGSTSGIFWFDWKRDYGLSQEFPQILGHMECSEGIPVKFPGGICLDTTNSPGVWVFETDNNQTVNLEEI